MISGIQLDLMMFQQVINGYTFVCGGGMVVKSYLGTGPNITFIHLKYCSPFRWTFTWILKWRNLANNVKLLILI